MLSWICFSNLSALNDYNMSFISIVIQVMSDYAEYLLQLAKNLALSVLSCIEILSFSGVNHVLLWISYVALVSLDLLCLEAKTVLSSVFPSTIFVVTV